MKNLLIILFLLLISNSYSQDGGMKINFKIENNKIVTSDKTSQLKLPLELVFSKAFKDKSITILNDKSEVLALNNSKFGDQNLTLLDGETFNIEIDKEGVVNPSLAADKKIDGKKILLQIEKYAPIVLAFDKTTDTENQDSNGDYKAGYLYYDAIKLSEEKDVAQRKQILSAYGISSSNISENLYLKEVFGADYLAGGVQGGGSLLSVAGGTDVTYFAAGLARFLAERAKDELNEAFFNKMKEQLNAYPELKTVFPKTTSILNTIETYSYASVIQILKEAFETDVQNLAENLYNIKELDSSSCSEVIICSCKEDANCKKIPIETCSSCERCKCESRLKKLNDFFQTVKGQWVALGMFTVKEAVQSSNPFELLQTVAHSEDLKKLKENAAKDNKTYDDYNVAASIELANFISVSLKSKEEDQMWITSKELNKLFKDSKTFKIYLGLLVAKEQHGEDKIDFYKANTLERFSKLLNDKYALYSKDLNIYISLVKNTYSAFSAANNAITKIQAATNKSIEAEPQALYDYYRTFSASLKAVTSSEALKMLTERSKITSRTEIIIKGNQTKYYNLIEQIIDPSVDIAYHIAVKKYSAAIYDATILLNNLNSNNEDFKKMTKSFVKYGTLVSTVAGAQSSDEVKKALDASVLPVGSASIKRKTDWSFSINAYVGAFWSYKNTAVSKDSIPSLGLAAPIGFNASKGTRNGKWGGFSANIQVIDLGALVNYYLIKGDAASLPNDFNVKLSNIFAPGFNLLYNIPKTPLSLGWGGQYIPTLYKYDQVNGANNLVATNAWRWQVSLLVDIPLFNLKVWDF